MLQDQLRELTWWLTKFQCRFKASHLSGKTNVLPDVLSRWHEGEKVRKIFYDMTKDQNYKHVHIDKEWFRYTHTW